MSLGSQPGATSPAVPAALPPNSAVRFNVTTDGSCRSVEWRVWTVKNADDVYVAARILGGEIKVSLHQTGSWSHGFTADGKAKDSLLPGQSRHFAIWQRPDEIAPGWTRAVQIIVPDAALQARPSPGTTKKPVADLRAAHGGNTTVAEVWLESAANLTPPPLAGSQLAGRLSQPGGGTTWIVGRRTTLPWDPYQRFSQEVTDARSRATKLDPNWAGNPPLSICLHDPDSRNPELILCELAVTA